MIYLRYESATPNARGHHNGIFMLANKLAHTGRLTAPDWTWWRTNNDWFDAAYTNLATVDPTLLDRYGIAWAERRTSNPGQVLYEDDVQVLAQPRTDGTVVDQEHVPAGQSWGPTKRR